ncbi:MAG TPA: HAD-IG family 5'-nucleotidase [Thermoanaerobaculaceae bacterium]|nr:HAD-IG family 5'-nucleotidase [Acidobacteriota bacterium]NLH09950.1 HAD-IG family 5'-nucleotidase [Holophagae bacterium]HPW56503.1 HAD-IG family 5'-nucleotidase [Thermoanaerobaculaceae bacterium]
MMGDPNLDAFPPIERRIFCNRTLNFRGVKAVGYDMDYTVVHYRVEPWERRAYEQVKVKLAELGWPVGDLHFDPELVIRGLIIDTERGNLIKANRFGYVTRASHGTVMLDFELQRKVYGRMLVELSDERYVFLNTLFSLSEACMYAQLVDRLDEGRFSAALGYADLYRQVRRSIDEAHMEGELKAEIVANPDVYVERDPDTVLALQDQRQSGKRLLLITNSDWAYTSQIMRYAFDPYLETDGGWRSLFDLVIVSARKPDFFSQRMPLFEVATEDGLLRPINNLRRPGVYVGGDATDVEQYLGVSGEEILYVGDHIFVDVHISKSVMRWRTALVLRELEDELRAIEEFGAQQATLARLMDEKVRLEYRFSQARMRLQRLQNGYGPATTATAGELREIMSELRTRLVALDEQIAPLARRSTEILNPRWGPLMRAGNDKSHLARQVERYADIYTSRVSNFLYETPFVYLRAPRGSLPHDDARVLA